MKRVYDYKPSQFVDGSAYANVKLSLIQYIVCKNAGTAYPSSDTQWHELGEGFWAWEQTNNSLDVNIPVEERHDLFACENSQTNPELKASIIKDPQKGNYRGYLYSQKDSKLTFVRTFELDQLEDAKNTLRVLVAINKDKNDEE